VRDVIFQFAPSHLEAELELLLDSDEAPSFQLGSERGGRLGVTTHLPVKREKKSMRGRVVLTENAAEATARLLTEDEAAAEP
jgi:predicted component of type VI protein secretion system